MKVYIHYAHPDTENAAILEVWQQHDGQKPKKKLFKDGECLKVYDTKPDDKQLYNERDWDGEE